MTYNSIIVFLDSSKRSDARMEFAIDLALRHGAHLTGLHVAHSTLYPYAPEAGIGLLIAKLDEYLQEQRTAVELRFNAAARRAGLSYDWDFLQGADARLAALRARTYDLVIVGQTDPDDPNASFDKGFPDSVVMGAGRPVLIIPYVGPLPAEFKSVLVAWNGSREAARAVADSLPMLARAANVTVVTVMEPRSGERGPELLPELDIAGYLSRKGVKAEVQQIPGTEMAVGEWLLSQVAYIGADLMVTGAYGQARMREWVLGGVTHTLLRSMTVPVLMSH